MLIGTYWSEQEACWQKISLTEDHQVLVQVARRRADYPNFAGDWQPVPMEGRTWTVDYTKGIQEAKPTTFCQKGGILYATHGAKNSVTGNLNIDKLNADGTWGPLRVHNLNPFGDLNNNNNNHQVTPYNQLPRTIEDLRDIWNNLRANDFRKELISGDTSTFVEDYQNEYLYTELVDALTVIGCTPQDYDSPLDYLQVLDNAVSNPDRNNPVNERIYALSSTTYFDQDLGLNPDNDADERMYLMERKISFCLELLKAEAAYIRVNLGLPAVDVPIYVPVREINQAENPNINAVI